MKEVSKAAKRHFRELTAVAHERELNKALAALSAHCDCWKKGELDASALNEEIHKASPGYFKGPVHVLQLQGTKPPSGKRDRLWGTE